MSQSLSVSRGLMDGTAAALDSLSRDVEGLGAALCQDPSVAERYLDQLQGVDRIAQSLEQLARVLRSPVPEDAIAEVRVGDLQAHLQMAHEAQNRAFPVSGFGPDESNGAGRLVLRPSGS